MKTSRRLPRSVRTVTQAVAVPSAVADTVTATTSATVATMSSPVRPEVSVCATWSGSEAILMPR